MTRKKISILLIVVIVICAAGTLAYPIRLLTERHSIDMEMETLREMRASTQQENTENSGESPVLRDETQQTLPASDESENAGTIDIAATSYKVSESGAFDTEIAESCRETEAKPISKSADEQTIENTVEYSVEPEPAVFDMNEKEQKVTIDTEPEPIHENDKATTGITEKNKDLEKASDQAVLQVNETANQPEKNDDTEKETELTAKETAGPVEVSTVQAESETVNAASVKAEQKEISQTVPDPENSIENEKPSEETAIVKIENKGTDETTYSVEDEAAEIPVKDRFERGEVLPYNQKEKVSFDPSKILPQYREIYALNEDIVGWLQIPSVGIDYPVMRNEDPDYYLKKDFFGKKNKNGQLILDELCDAWTPSYNLVISGHNTPDGVMFGDLPKFAYKNFWEKHKTFTFDTLMREGQYVIIAAFKSMDYKEGQKGFRYNANLIYRQDVKTWLDEVMKSSLYDTGIDAEFGDEFLTLTTCYYHVDNGRFVVVARRVREGEVFE